VALAAALLLATACAGDAELGSLYDFQGRDCGTVATGPVWSIPTDASDCLLHAWRTGTPAHLRIEGRTVEGDPITAPTR